MYLISLNLLHYILYRPNFRLNPYMCLIESTSLFIPINVICNCDILTYHNLCMVGISSTYCASVLIVMFRHKIKQVELR